MITSPSNLKVVISHYMYIKAGQKLRTPLNMSTFVLNMLNDPKIQDEVLQKKILKSSLNHCKAPMEARSTK